MSLGACLELLWGKKAKSSMHFWNCRAAEGDIKKEKSFNGYHRAGGKPAWRGRGEKPGVATIRD